MIITCDKCATRFNLDESLLDADGSTVRCSRCQHIFTAFPPSPEPDFDDPGLEDTDFTDTDFDSDLEFDDSDFDEDEDEALTENDFQETDEPEKMEMESLDSDEIEIEFEEEESAAAEEEDDEDEDESDRSDELKLSGEPDRWSDEPKLPDEPDRSEDSDKGQEELELDESTSEDKEPEFDLAFDLDEIASDTDEPDLETPEEKEPDVEDQPSSLPLDERDPLEELTEIPAGQKDEFEPDEEMFDGLDEFDDPDFDETDMDDTDPSDAPPHEVPPPRRPARASLIQPRDREEESMDVEIEDEAPRKRSPIGLPVLVILILFVFAGGGYVAATFLGYKIPFLPEIQIPFIEQYLPQKTPETVTYPDPIPDQKSVTGRFLTNDTAGELFIITGKIENPAQIAYRRIQVKGTLFQKEKKAAMTQVAYCGNIIPEETLKTAPIQDLTAQLKIPGGAADINENIMPGDTVPFMLVFADLPRNLENFTVEVAGFENATP